MRETLSWIVILLLILPLGPLSLEGTELRTSNGDEGPTLRQRLRHMPAEAACFSDGLSGQGGLWPPEVDVRGPVTQETGDVARLRVRIRQLSPGTEVTILLRDGSRVQGEIESSDKEEFRLLVPHSATRGARQKKSFRYEAVESADLPEAKGWSSPEKIPGYGKGRRIEVLLVDGTLLEGRLSHITGTTFGLEVGERDVRDYSFNQVASVRTRGMATSTKLLIVGGLAIGVLVGVNLALCAGPGCD